MNRRPVDFGQVRNLISPHAALQLIGWRPVWDRGPTLMRGPCPIHKSREGSRSLAVTDRVCFCHSCKFSGDAVRIWAKLNGVDDLTAALELCDKLHIAVPFL